MNITITKFDVPKNKRNEVTSSKIFKPRRLKDPQGNWRFDVNGLYSEKIFGRIGSCKCKSLHEVGYCEHCECRVIDKNNMPEFYIDMEIPLPHIGITYDFWGSLGKKAKQIVEYDAFVYDGKFVEFNIESADFKIENYHDTNKLFIGLEALQRISELNKDDIKTWYLNNTISTISVPHPIYRPIVESGGKPIFSKLNRELVSIISTKNKVLSFYEYNKGDIGLLVLFRLMRKNYEHIIQTFFKIMITGKKCIHSQEIIGQPITGAIRAVITNEYGLNEDTILVGSRFAEILWPYLYEECKGDIDLMNKEIERKKYLLIVNRPPTIGQKSIIAMKPYIDPNPERSCIVSTDPIIYDGLAADTDGDVFFCIALYSEQANENAKILMPSNNYIGCNNGLVRNRIPENFMYAYKHMQDNEAEELEDIEYYAEYSWEEILREDYMQVYRILGDYMWNIDIPTVHDIASYIEEGNDKTASLIDFFKVRDKFIEQIKNTKEGYEDSVSKEYMKKVIAANNTDISDSGWFYKKVMSSADDIRTFGNDCFSEGVYIEFEDITKEIYDYKIRFLWINELENYAYDTYDYFLDELEEKGLYGITYRTPIMCLNAHKRSLCKKCVGILKLSHTKFFKTHYIGIWSALMITEFSTQGSLDSMNATNRGMSQNINKLLDKPFPSKLMNWEDVQKFILKLTSEIGKVGIESRFYEILLLSRVYKTKEKYFAASFQYSFQNQEDLLGIFAYNTSFKKFIQMLTKSSFKANSIKSQIMFGKYAIRESQRLEI